MPASLALALALTAPVPRAHAHNDYEHERPLHDALAHGFRSVEADVWLTREGLLVAHTPFGLKAGRTLQALYLDPLRARVRANGGSVHRNGPPFYLLVDVKTDAATTGDALAKVLADYADILTTTRDGKTERKAVTVVVSGNADRAALTKAAVRHAAIDGRPADLDGDAPAELVPWVSASWGSQFRWDGTGPMPTAERDRLREFVRKAHAKGRMVRFWGAPETPAVWRELVAADADLINTDRLADLRAFLRAEDRPRTSP
ncbi:MAG: phosphatidylinositol-specific phospholipase C/glycerophosphodiester phosphodiesterase family protein [Gemmataceae bacterium]